MPRRGYTVPPVSGSSVPDFCKVFGTLYSIWAQEHGFGEEPRTLGRTVQKYIEGNYRTATLRELARLTSCLRIWLAMVWVSALV